MHKENKATCSKRAVKTPTAPRPTSRVKITTGTGKPLTKRSK